MRSKILIFFLLPPLLLAQTLTSVNFHGSGSDTANGVTTDSSGNIYVVGTTTSFDLPLLNPAQSTNPGTQLLFSSDDGFSWKPLGNLPNPYASYPYTTPPPIIAIDPTNTAIFYAAFNSLLFKTTDGGRHFSAGISFQPAASRILTLAVDPTNPSNVYAGTDSGVFKSADAGATWNNASSGLLILNPPYNVGSLVIDPFHPQSLWAVVGGVGFLSTDGANSWKQLSLPEPAAGNASIFQFAFDAVKPGIVYAYGFPNQTAYLLKSTDGGQTWSQLNIPFTQGPFAADPVHNGYLYNISSNGNPPAFFYRSSDGGATWQSFPYPEPYAASIAIDPRNANIILTDSFRSNNGGRTWLPIPVSRAIQATFAPTGKGITIAGAPVTSDVFLAKFAPDGKTLLFATYFGGMGNESASGVQVDKSGNIWIAGNTNSVDLPVSKNAFQKRLKGLINIFLAEFSPEGKLLASTYLGGSQSEGVAAIGVDPDGHPWIYGQSNSPDFPAPPPIQAGAPYAFLVALDAAASHILHSVSIDGVNYATGMAIDAEGNVLLTGTSYYPNLALTPGIVHGTQAPNQSSGQAVLIKMDNSGKTTFSTYLGGATPSQVANGQEFENIGVAVTADAGGIYLTGLTAAQDFPVTPGAYQTHLGTGCSYPSSAVYTGFIGTIYTFLDDDAFVMKLSPDGKKLIYSTLLGGSCYDRPTDIAVTPSGAVFVAGESNSVDFPLVHPLLAAPATQNYESFISMIGPNGDKLPFSTFLLAGSLPVLAVRPDGMLEIAGSTGFDAQTQTFSGSPYGPIVPMTRTFLASLNLSGSSPALNLTGVLNGFSLLPGPVAPGEIVQLSVPDFHPAKNINIGLAEGSSLGATLGGTQVLFDGKPAPMIAVASGKIVCIAPQDFGSSLGVTVQVNFNGALSNPLTVPTAPVALGLLSADGSGTGLANARNSDGKLNSPSHPARRGTSVTVFFTGAGVPPAGISVQLAIGAAGGTVSIAPLKGFVPGIYAARFEAPTDLNISSPLYVSLFSGFSTSQSLLVYIQ